MVTIHNVSLILQYKRILHERILYERIESERILHEHILYERILHEHILYEHILHERIESERIESELVCTIWWLTEHKAFLPAFDHRNHSVLYKNNFLADVFVSIVFI